MSGIAPVPIETRTNIGINTVDIWNVTPTNSLWPGHADTNNHPHSKFRVAC